MRNPSLRICRSTRLLSATGKKASEPWWRKKRQPAGFLVTGADSHEYILKNRSMMSTIRSLLRRHWPRITGRLPWSSWELTRRRWRMYTPFPCSHRRCPGQGQRSELLVHLYTGIFPVFSDYFLRQMIAVSVTSEKSNRAIEILVTSVDSNSLIFGKVIAGALAGIVQAGVILGSAVIAYRATRTPGDTCWIHFPNSGPGVDDLYCIRDSGISALRLSVRHGGGAGVQDRRYQQEFRCGNLPVSGILSDYHVRPDLSGFPAVKAASYIPFTSSNAMLLRASMGTVGTLGDCSLAGCSGCFLYPGGECWRRRVPVRNSPVRKSH